VTPPETGDRACAPLRIASVPRSAVGVSVVIPSYNTSGYVVAALRSALQQTYSALEVIVVDDGSTDDSVEQILTVCDDRLTCVTQPHLGLAAARNTGIRFARGKYVAFLDSDDLWSPLKVAHHLAAMEKDATVGVTFSYSAYIGENGEATGEYLISRCGHPGVQQLMRRNHIGNGSSAIVRRECFDIAGVFDEELSGCADWEFWVRVAAVSGLSFQLIPRVLTGYRIRTGSLSVPAGAYEHFLSDGLEAIQRFGRSVPAQSRGDASRAQLYRVTSHKALLTGDFSASRRFLCEAVRHSPFSILRDIRAWALIAFHLAAVLLPKRMQGRLYRAARMLLANGVWRYLVPVAGLGGRL
jgi:glycosyltransferase involved in cell wall biosynthesis